MVRLRSVQHTDRVDKHGNQFSFRAKVKNSQGHQLGRWAWDVYLVKHSD